MNKPENTETLHIKTVTLRYVAFERRMRMVARPVYRHINPQYELISD